MSNIRFNLSPLAALPAFLAERALSNSDLEEVLQDAIVDEDCPAATQAVLATLPALLDEWLAEGEQELWATNQFTEAYKWLAIHEHLRVVREFRGLL